MEYKKYLQEKILKLRFISALVHTIIAMSLILSMGRRLEKYYLFCNTAFLSLFTIKFIRYIFVRQNTLKSWNKKACKIYPKFPIYIESFRYIYTKHTLSWNKKRLRNKSEISDIYRKFPMFIYDKIHSELEQKTLTK